MQGGKGADWWGSPGGKFSLGRLREEVDTVWALCGDEDGCGRGH
jgi:hypothetical protein